MDYKPSWNLRSIPDDVFFSESGRRQAAMRVNPGGFREGAGRKAIMVPCPRCGERVTRTEARRGHGCKR
jgi:predicted RNA-binding Zn-ribbon protein involved in translation (DUF1610 family)